MPSFSYVAVSPQGKQVKDNVEASSLETAKNSLRAAGYTILEIKPLSALNQDINLPFLGNPTAKDMAVFCRQFQSILRAGVPVSQVLTMLGQQTENAKLAEAIRDMQTSIEYDQKKAFEGADFIYAKNWSAYSGDNYGKILCTDRDWTVDAEEMALTNNAFFMHCLPVRRNMIVTDDVIESPQSLVIPEAANRVVSAQTILKEILRGL